MLGCCCQWGTHASSIPPQRDHAIAASVMPACVGGACQLRRSLGSSLLVVDDEARPVVMSASASDLPAFDQKQDHVALRNTVGMTTILPCLTLKHAVCTTSCGRRILSSLLSLHELCLSTLEGALNEHPPGGNLVTLHCGALAHHGGALAQAPGC